MLDSERSTSPEKSSGECSRPLQKKSSCPGISGEQLHTEFPVGATSGNVTSLSDSDSSCDSPFDSPFDSPCDSPCESDVNFQRNWGFRIRWNINNEGLRGCNRPESSSGGEVTQDCGYHSGSEISTAMLAAEIIDKYPPNTPKARVRPSSSLEDGFRQSELGLDALMLSSFLEILKSNASLT